MIREESTDQSNQPPVRKGTDDHPDEVRSGDSRRRRKDTERGGRYAWYSQSYISRLEKKIMQRLRREMVKYS